MNYVRLRECVSKFNISTMVTKHIHEEYFYFQNDNLSRCIDFLKNKENEFKTSLKKASCLIKALRIANHVSKTSLAKIKRDNKFGVIIKDYYYEIFNSENLLMRRTIRHEDLTCEGRMFLLSEGDFSVKDEWKLPNFIREVGDELR